MRKILLAILCSLIFSIGAIAKEGTGYAISITLKGYPNKKFYLGYYFGDKQYIRDSAVTDKTGKLVFKGKDSLEGGVYLIATMRKELLFDFIVTEQVFSLETDSADIIGAMKIKGSPENDVFFAYTKYTAEKGKVANTYEEQLKKAKEENDTATRRIVEEKYRKFGEDLSNYRKNIMKAHPTTLIAKIFKMMTDIEIPDAPKNFKGEIIDSNFQYNYYYNHFFDNFDWADSRLVRTPVFHGKFETFLLKLTPQIPDSIIKSADFILRKAEAGRENFKYCLFWITNHYETSQYMGMDKVFVHMVDEYYLKGKAFWTDETTLVKMKDRRDKLFYNLIGKKAVNLNMVDSANVYHSLYNVKAKYTLVIFWDATCGKCKEELPKLKTLYDELNPETNSKEPKKVQDGKFFDVYGVSLTADPNEWKNYLKANKMKWLNVHDPNNETNFRGYYDVYSTPVLYLLDENKKIIAKRLGVEQLKDFINDLEKGNKK